MASRKGCPNRNKKFLLDRLQDMYGDDFNPVLRMAEQASRLHEMSKCSEDLGLIKSSLDAWDRVARYVVPQIKAQDIANNSLIDLPPVKIELIGVAPEYKQ